MIKEEIKNSLRSMHPDMSSTSSANVREISSEEEAVPPGMEYCEPDSSSSDNSDTEISPNEVDHLLKAVRATMAMARPLSVSVWLEKLEDHKQDPPEIDSKRARVLLFNQKRQRPR